MGNEPVSIFPHNMVIQNNRLVFWLQLIVVWTLAFMLFSFLRNFGWPAAMGFTPKNYFAPGLNLALGAIVGTAYFLIEVLMNRRTFRRLSFLRWAGLKSVLHLLLALGLFALAILFFPIFNPAADEAVVFREFFFSRLMVVSLVYFSVVSLIITLFIQMNQKMGRGILKNMLLGKYHHPREEERIFLFIDLKSSTTIAERLGHVWYSRLIQDCFADITDAVVKHNAEIYQYVGDEVILCWESAAGIKRNRCIEAYFTFTQLLIRRSAYYEKHYGLQPIFKAGAHVGRMTVAEVGLIKRELAYHGDVLNTAARIQSKCNALGEQLLISPALASALALDNYEVVRHAPVELIGKQEAMEVIGVHQIATESQPVAVAYPTSP